MCPSALLCIRGIKAGALPPVHLQTPRTAAAQVKEVTASDIKRAFRKAALKWHPDRRDGLAEQDRGLAHQRFQVTEDAGARAHLRYLASLISLSGHFGRWRLPVIKITLVLPGLPMTACQHQYAMNRHKCVF